MNILKKYKTPFSDNTLGIAISMTKIMMDICEDVHVTKEDIIKVLNKEEVLDLSKTVYRLIYQFTESLITFLSLDRKLVFDDITSINEKIQYKITREGENGKWGNKLRFVRLFGEDKVFFSETNKEEKKEYFEKMIKEIKKNNNQNYRRFLILNFFVKMITEQWFNNGNKRTSLVVCNKLLLDYCCDKQNNLLLNFNKETFTLLFVLTCYEKYNMRIPEGISFLKQNDSYQTDFVFFLNNCIMQNEQQITINNLLFSQLKSFFDLTFINDDELDKLSQNKIEKTQNQKMQKEIKEEFKKLANTMSR